MKNPPFCHHPVHSPAARCHRASALRSRPTAQWPDTRAYSKRRALPRSHRPAYQRSAGIGQRQSTGHCLAFARVFAAVPYPGCAWHVRGHGDDVGPPSAAFFYRASGRPRYSTLSRRKLVACSSLAPRLSAARSIDPHSHPPRMRGLGSFADHGGLRRACRP
jgi:hypothetical protein